MIFGLLGLEINLHVLLIASLAWVASHTVKLGFSFVSIKTAMSAGIEKGLGAIYIFILIGGRRVTNVTTNNFIYMRLL